MDYLTAQGIPYEVITHPQATSMIEAARGARLPTDQVAKGVLLEDEAGYLLAILPASHHIEMAELRRWLDRHLGLATEREVESLFGDCEKGAVPASGAAYGLDTICEDCLSDQPDVYIEAGDHRTLLHVAREDFAKLTSGAMRGRFSTLM
jgi:Ala-tRNA(Pro) deacylase